MAMKNETQPDLLQTDTPPTDTPAAAIAVVIEGHSVAPDSVRRGLFELLIKQPDDPSAPMVRLDTTLLAAHVQILLAQAAETLKDAEDVVVDAGTYEYAATLRRQARDDGQALEEARTAITSKIDELKEAVMVEFRGDKTLKDGPQHKLKTAVAVLDDKLNKFIEAEDRKAKELARIERERVDAERRRQEEAQRVIQQRAAQEQERLRQEAEQAAQAGDDTKVLELVQQANVVADTASERVEDIFSQTTMLRTAPVATRQLPRAAGYTPTKKWELIIEDAGLFFQGIADGRIPRLAAKADQSFCNSHATLNKGDVDWPGCKAKRKLGGSSR